MTKQFPALFSPLKIGHCELANRIVFAAHHTHLAERAPSDALIAYHESRAAAGAGLIITEIVAAHASAGFSANLLAADSAEVVPAYRRLTERCHAHGAKIFAQLFHPGREILASRSGLAPLAWAPSAAPNERFHIMPKALPAALIADLIAGFGRAAGHLTSAGFDGFEIVASHGYLPAQFLNPRVNRRGDDYGGDFARRLRFVEEIADAARAGAPGAVLGLRISADELDPAGLSAAEVVEICAALKPRFDYYSVVLGTSVSLGGAVHIVPPMGSDGADIAPFAGAIRRAANLPVIATGRITRPQEAERILAAGDADLIGLARALICDARWPAKAARGQSGAIRVCIGCNQSCIGRAHRGLGISCIQRPESGRELEFGELPAVESARQIVVAGGGVAGMKAAAVAAERGHRVELFEKSPRLGGQGLLAMRLPGRAEFGGMVANLEREMRAAGVAVHTAAPLDRAAIADLRERGRADCVVNATGARPFMPAIAGVDQRHVFTAWEAIAAPEKVAKFGRRVVIADWKGDWPGLGLAELLAAAGAQVQLCVNAEIAGEALPIYTRNFHLGRARKLGARVQTHLRLVGVDEKSVYFQDVLTFEAVEFAADAVVLSLGCAADDALENELSGMQIDTEVIGDCHIPRTAEEAVHDGLLAGRRL